MGQLRAFVEGNEAVDFQPKDRNEAYGFVRETPGRPLLVATPGLGQGRLEAARLPPPSD